MTDTNTPIIPDLTAAKATIWTTPERNPYLMSINDIAHRIGIKPDSMQSNATARPEWFPLAPVTLARSGPTGMITRYYRRSEAERWIRQRLIASRRARNGHQIAQDAMNPEKSHPPTPDDVSGRTGDSAKEAA